METIKKYNNRKLYSTKTSSYVTLEYILDLVRTRQKFRVVENKSQNDITTKTIQSSLTELPMDLGTLHKLIRGE